MRFTILTAEKSNTQNLAEPGPDIRTDAATNTILAILCYYLSKCYFF